jgi:hypothetical protein
MNSLKNERGAALVWAVAATMILTILIGSTLTFSYSYYRRSLHNNHSRQAYINARSVVEAISREIKGDTVNGTAIVELLSVPGDRVEIDNITFHSGDVPGTFSAFVELSAVDEIKIKAVSTVGSRTKSVTARLKKDFGGTTLPIGQDFPGLEIPEENVEFVTGSTSIDNKTGNDFYAAGDTTVIFLNSADFNGRIYAEGGSTINISQGSKFGGEIYAQSGVEFVYTKLHNYFNGRIYVKNGAVLKVNEISYTITFDEEGMHISPNGLVTEFEALISLYTGPENSENGGWGDTAYE